MDLRYQGQEFHLSIRVSDAELRSDDKKAIRRRFDELHEHRFGHAATDEPLELVNLRLTARGARPKINFPPLKPHDSSVTSGTRSIFLENPCQPVDCRVYSRERLGAGARLRGPCVIEEFGSTTLLFDGDEAEVAPTGEIIVKVAHR
jgi:N-methylhydantoinase A